MFHMGWFLNYTAPSWNRPWSGETARDWLDPAFWTDLGRAMERARFDFMMLEDGQFIPDAYEESSRYYLATGQQAPKHDPAVLAPLILSATRHLGLIMTVSTPYVPPFQAARFAASLDGISGGRAGINLVTAHNVRTAQNFGRDEHYAHDERYRMADEWIRVVDELWGSWSPDALVADLETGVFVDHEKVRAIDFEGEWYRSRGPLNTMPSPQGRPIVCQAGGSPAGRDLAARHADTVVAAVPGVDAMKEYRADMDARIARAGRDPRDVKILFTVSPVLGETHDEALAKQERLGRPDLEAGLARLSWSSGIDFSRFDLDEPVPEISTQGATTTTNGILDAEGPKATLREIAERPVRVGSFDVAGTADEVADTLGEVMDEVGGDGFLIAGQLTRRYVAEITDGLAPALRRRGLIRSEYSGSTLRENLLEF